MEEINEVIIYFFYTIEKDIKREIISSFPLRIIDSIEKTDEDKRVLKINLYEIKIDKEKLPKKEKNIKIQLVTDNEKNTYEYFFHFPDDEHKSFYFYDDIEFQSTSFFVFFKFFRPVQKSNLKIEEKYELFKSIKKTR